MRALILALAATLAGCASVDTAGLGEKFRMMRESGAATRTNSTSCQVVRVAPTISQVSCD